MYWYMGTSVVLLYRNLLLITSAITCPNQLCFRLEWQAYDSLDHFLASIYSTPKTLPLFSFSLVYARKASNKHIEQSSKCSYRHLCLCNMRIPICLIFNGDGILIIMPS
ncbi:hypothetical protein BX070DRAFT_229295 [Coemansia spiralis]|nr:hypothetical protein BX070DRAFT_229295 [Coemansia spiralis]